MPRIKVCGLTRREDADVAVAAGASYLGVIFAGGPRLVGIDQARLVLGAARHGVQRVAVFGHDSNERILAVADALSLDVMQLHGDPTVEIIRQLRDSSERAVWPVLRVEGSALPALATELAHAAGNLVLDAKVVGQLGGTGVALDWAALQADVHALRAAVPHARLVLAGGLRDSNVAQAVGLLSPDVVDVSSGVEVTPGVKDPAAIQRFVSAVTTVKGIDA